MDADLDQLREYMSQFGKVASISVPLVKISVIKIGLHTAAMLQSAHSTFSEPAHRFPSGHRVCKLCQQRVGEESAGDA